MSFTPTHCQDRIFGSRIVDPMQLLACEALICVGRLLPDEAEGEGFHDVVILGEDRGRSVICMFIVHICIYIHILYTYIVMQCLLIR